MGLSARTSDLTGLPLGEGFITLSTSAGNAILVKDPAEANRYLTENAAQMGRNEGSFNTSDQTPAQA